MFPSHSKNNPPPPNHTSQHPLTHTTPSPLNTCKRVNSDHDIKQRPQTAERECVEWCDDDFRSCTYIDPHHSLDHTPSPSPPLRHTPLDERRRVETGWDGCNCHTQRTLASHNTSCIRGSDGMSKGRRYPSSPILLVPKKKLTQRVKKHVHLLPRLLFPVGEMSKMLIHQNLKILPSCLPHFYLFVIQALPSRRSERVQEDPDCSVGSSGS